VAQGEQGLVETGFRNARRVTLNVPGVNGLIVAEKPSAGRCRMPVRMRHASQAGQPGLARIMAAMRAAPQAGRSRRVRRSIPSQVSLLSCRYERRRVWQRITTESLAVVTAAAAGGMDLGLGQEGQGAGRALSRPFVNPGCALASFDRKVPLYQLMVQELSMH